MRYRNQQERAKVVETAEDRKERSCSTYGFCMSDCTSNEFVGYTYTGMQERMHA